MLGVLGPYSDLIKGMGKSGKSEWWAERGLARAVDAEEREEET